MASIFRSYQSFLARKPLLGNVLTCGVHPPTISGRVQADEQTLFATGDIIAQQIVEKKGQDHDFARTGRIIIWGGGIFAPAVTGWFGALQRIPIQSKWPAALAKTGLDQFAFAPIAISGFFCVTGFLEGKSSSEIKQKWSESLFPTLKANWSVWIPVQLANMLVPPPLRVLVVSAVNVPWNTFLSLQAAKGAPATAKVEQVYAD